MLILPFRSAFVLKQTRGYFVSRVGSVSLIPNFQTPFFYCVFLLWNIIILLAKKWLCCTSKSNPLCRAWFCCLTLTFITGISGNWAIFGFSRMNFSSGCSLHALEAELGVHSLDDFVGNLSPAELEENRDLIRGFSFFTLCFWIWLLHGDLEFSLLLLGTGFAVWWIEMLLLSCWCLPLSWFIWIPSDYAVIVCPLSGQQWGVYKRWSLIAFKAYIGNMCFYFKILSCWYWASELRLSLGTKALPTSFSLKHPTWFGKQNSAWKSLFHHLHRD